MSGNKVDPISLEMGKTTNFRLNRAARYKIVFQNGTTLEGISPPNEDFKITPFEGDIKSFDLYFDDIDPNLKVVD